MIDLVDVDQRHFDDLAKLEKEFEKVDVEILRETTIKQSPLLARRNAITSQIPNFWALVMDAASGPLRFDEQITLEDAYMIRTSLKSINVTRQGVFNGGDPRNVEITFEFSENEWMTDSVLSKKFTFQGGSVGGLTGLISEPVPIHWKPGKDLTGGVSDAAVKAFEERKECSKAAREGKGKGKKTGVAEAVLEELMSNGNSSFFNWFGWSGKHIALGEKPHDHEDSDDCCGGMNEDSPVECFPFGDELAVQIAEDMYPNAIKYFTESMEEAGDSSDSSDDDEDIDLLSEGEEEQLAKNGLVFGGSGGSGGSSKNENTHKNGNGSGHHHHHRQKQQQQQQHQDDDDDDDSDVAVIEAPAKKRQRK